MTNISFDKLDKPVIINAATGGGWRYNETVSIHNKK